MNLLTSSHLILRAVEPSDVEVILAFENDTTIWQVSNTLAPFSRFEIEEYALNAQRDIFAARQLRLMIDLAGSGIPNTSIGAIDLFDFDPLHLRAGIGIIINEQYRELGYAKESLTILLTYCRDILLLHQVYANIALTNTHSIKLFESLGFSRSGAKVDWINAGDGWVTEYLYQHIF